MRPSSSSSRSPQQEAEVAVKGGGGAKGGWGEEGLSYRPPLDIMQAVGQASVAGIHCDCPVLGSACSSLVPPPTSRSLPTSSSACYCCATASAAWVPLQATALGRGTIRAKSWCRRQLAAHACIRCRRPGWLDAQADPILADPFSLEAHCYASAAAAAALPSHRQSKVLGPKMLIPSCESLAPRQN